MQVLQILITYYWPETEQKVCQACQWGIIVKYGKPERIVALMQITTDLGWCLSMGAKSFTLYDFFLHDFFLRRVPVSYAVTVLGAHCLYILFLYIYLCMFTSMQSRHLLVCEKKTNIIFKMLILQLHQACMFLKYVFCCKNNYYAGELACELCSIANEIAMMRNEETCLKNTDPDTTAIVKREQLTVHYLSSVSVCNVIGGSKENRSGCKGVQTPHWIPKI